MDTGKCYFLNKEGSDMSLLTLSINDLTKIHLEKLQLKQSGESMKQTEDGVSRSRAAPKWGACPLGRLPGGGQQ